ncbi:MAG: hypothetical protein EFT35_04925 [Methanophagales archaeon ANME-1-THS]|nr:MAG: hypothetical protein EFT35_04925 [Methanophagales archaeon ANME-1-THS]
MSGYSYKVEFFPIEEVLVEKQVDRGRIEKTLNRYAKRGLRLAQVALCGQLGLICIFEQEEAGE